MIADLAVRARLRDAAIAFIVVGKRSAARSATARANVSIELTRRHFDTVDDLPLTHDEHVAALTRSAKNDVIRGPMPSVLETLRGTGQGNILDYLTHHLTDSSAAVDILIDQFADDTADYVRCAIDVGSLTPIPNVPATTRMLIVHPLGSLVLDRHLRRLLDVGVTVENIMAESGVTDYVQVQLALFANLSTPHLLKQLRPQLEEKTKEGEKTEGKEKEE